jgi:predicted DCC family thiol-disulfide oxidoreductase YuxK
MDSDDLLYPLTVFYDASCPLCANEMHALRDLDTSGHLELVDCSAPDFRADDLTEGITREALMRRIHARDAVGTWVVGLDCFEAVYRAAGLEGAARVWGDPRLRPLLDGLYPWIARNRQMLSKLGVSALIRYFIPKPRTIACRVGPNQCSGT